MDDPNRNLPPCGTQIDDLPSSLIMDILSRLPNRSLLSCRAVCRSWNLVFSDPLFVKLHFARSPTYLIRWSYRKPMKFYSSYCRILVPGMSSQASAATQDGSECTCINSSNGLLCLESYGLPHEIFVCNPILGQYITIETPYLALGGNGFYLGFSSRSNQFKVLQIIFPSARHIGPYLARIYTIGDGTRQWKSIGIAPSCLHFMYCGFLNGSIHWVDDQTHEIFYFNFDSEQFGSLPSPPVCRDGRRRCPIMGVLDGCLFFYAGRIPLVTQLWNMEFWIMKEYGVEESWTQIFSIDNIRTDEVFSSLHNKLTLLYENCKIQFGYYGTAYTPSFVSLQDVAKGEQLTMMS